MNETTILIGQIYGPVALVAGLGMLINKKTYSKVLVDFAKSPGLAYYGGAMALVAGIVIVKFHNIWELNLAGFVSFLGWAAIVKGILLILAPEKFIGFFVKLLPKIHYIMALIALLLGAWISYSVYM